MVPMLHAISDDPGAPMHLRILTEPQLCVHIWKSGAMKVWTIISSFATPDNCTWTLKMIELYQLLLTWPKVVTVTLFACQKFATKYNLFQLITLVTMCLLVLK